MTRLLPILTLLLWSFSAVAVFLWHWPKVVWFTRWWGALCVARYRQPLRRDMVIRFFIVLLLSALGASDKVTLWIGQAERSCCIPNITGVTAMIHAHPHRRCHWHQPNNMVTTRAMGGLEPVHLATVTDPAGHQLSQLDASRLGCYPAGKFVTNNQTYTLVGQGILFTAKTGNVVTVKTSVDLIHWQLQTNIRSKFFGSMPMPLSLISNTQSRSFRCAPM